MTPRTLAHALLPLALAASMGCEHKVSVDPSTLTYTGSPATQAVYDAQAGGVWIVGEAPSVGSSSVTYCSVKAGQPQCVKVSAQ